MNNINFDLANKQAKQLLIAYIRKLQLLKAIHAEKLSLEHYEPEVREVYCPQNKTTVLKFAYRHISHFIAPLRHKIFRIDSSGLHQDILMNISISSLVDSLSGYGKPEHTTEEALMQSQILIDRYEACIQLQTKICANKVAIVDYHPRIRIRPSTQHGKTHYCVSYRHKYFLGSARGRKVYTCDSMPNNPDFTLDDCINSLIAELKYSQ